MTFCTFDGELKITINGLDSLKPRVDAYNQSMGEGFKYFGESFFPR